MARRRSSDVSLRGREHFLTEPSVRHSSMSRLHHFASESDIGNQKETIKPEHSISTSQLLDITRKRDSSSSHNLSLDGDFVLSSAKKNKAFHQLFRSVPLHDPLIDSKCDFPHLFNPISVYLCPAKRHYFARKIGITLINYVSRDHVCFHSNILGWITNLVIKYSDIKSVERRMSAFVIPNALSVETNEAKYLFTSFLSREVAFHLLQPLWQAALRDSVADLIFLPYAPSLKRKSSSVNGTEKVNSIRGKDFINLSPLQSRDNFQNNESDLDSSANLDPGMISPLSTDSESKRFVKYDSDIPTVIVSDPLSSKHAPEISFLKRALSLHKKKSDSKIQSLKPDNQFVSLNRPKSVSHKRIERPASFDNSHVLIDEKPEEGNLLVSELVSTDIKPVVYEENMFEEPDLKLFKKETPPLLKTNTAPAILEINTSLFSHDSRKPLMPNNIPTADSIIAKNSDEAFNNPSNRSKPPAKQGVIKRTPFCNCTDHCRIPILDRVFPVHINKLKKLLFDDPDSKFFHNLLSNISAKSTSVSITQWKNDQRTIEYIGLTRIPLFPRTAKRIMTQKITRLVPDEILCIRDTTLLVDVPNASNFKVLCSHCYMSAGPSETRILVSFHIEFVKSSWLKGAIEKGIIETNTINWRIFEQLLFEHINSNTENDLDSQHSSELTNSMSKDINVNVPISSETLPSWRSRIIQIFIVLTLMLILINIKLFYGTHFASHSLKIFSATDAVSKASSWDTISESEFNRVSTFFELDKKYKPSKSNYPLSEVLREIKILQQRIYNQLLDYSDHNEFDEVYNLMKNLNE